MKKKLLIIAVLAGVAFAGCTIYEKDHSAKNDNSQLITFTNPVLNPTLTRGNAVVGEIAALAYPKNEEFFVYGIKHNGEFMKWSQGTDFPIGIVSYNENYKGWAPEIDKVWPDEDTDAKLSFTAYSPADLVADCATPDGVKYEGEGGLTLTDFTVRPNGYTKAQMINAGEGTESDDVQYDLMFSDRTVNQTASSMRTDEAPYNGVDLKFHHALSSIVFTVRTELAYGPGIKFELKKIELIDVMSKGDFKEGMGDAGVEYAQLAAWSGQETPATYTVFAQEFHFAKIPYSEVPVIDLTKEDADSISLEGKNLILLPQKFTSDDAKISISYNLIKDGVSEEKVVTKALKDIKFDAEEVEWKIGKRYTYNIIFKVNVIYFNPVADDWVDADASGNLTVM